MNDKEASTTGDTLVSAATISYPAYAWILDRKWSTDLDSYMPFFGNGCIGDAREKNILYASVDGLITDLVSQRLTIVADSLENVFYFSLCLLNNSVFYSDCRLAQQGGRLMGTIMPSLSRMQQEYCIYRLHLFITYRSFGTDQISVRGCGAEFALSMMRADSTSRLFRYDELALLAHDWVSRLESDYYQIIANVGLQMKAFLHEKERNKTQSLL